MSIMHRRLRPHVATLIAAVCAGCLPGTPAWCATPPTEEVSAADWQSIQQAHEASQLGLRASNNAASPAENFGRAVAISGDIAVVGAPLEGGSGAGVNPPSDDAARDSGAVYVFVRSGGNWSQEAYLKSGLNGVGDQFGASVAISGNTVAVGAPGEDGSNAGVNPAPSEGRTDSGAAYVFVRGSNGWTLQATLKAHSVSEGDGFGNAVAISGDTVVVGASRENGGGSSVNAPITGNVTDAGAAYVYVRSGATWSFQAYIKPSNPGRFDGFGGAVSVSGDTLIVGSPGEDSSSTGVNPAANESALDSGAAYVFHRSMGGWTQQAFLKASINQVGEAFGSSVSVSGSSLVVGAPKRAGLGPRQVLCGAAYIFVRQASTWSEQAFIRGSQVSSHDLFGSSVAIEGDRVAIGAANPGTAAGSTYVYGRSGTVWNELARLAAASGEAGDSFGASVGISNSAVLVGAPFEGGSGRGVNPPVNDDAPGAGAAYLFSAQSDAFGQTIYFKASNTPDGSSGVNDRFGSAIAVSGDTLVVGAPHEDGSGTGFNPESNEDAADSGAVHVYSRSDGVWRHEGYLKASNTGPGDLFGSSVSISGDTLVVGAPNEDGGGQVVNPQDNEAVQNAGAAYIFRRDGAVWTQIAHLKSNNPRPNGFFGVSAAIAGSRVVVGSSRAVSNGAGGAFVFGESGSAWTLEALLRASNEEPNDSFGAAVSICNSTVVVGAPKEDGNGTGVNPAQNNGAIDSGAAYVFTTAGGQWSQAAYLKGARAQAGALFGHSVSVWQDFLAVGVPRGGESAGADPVPQYGDPPGPIVEDPPPEPLGAVDIFQRFGGSWSARPRLSVDHWSGGGRFGYHVAAFAGRLAVGSPLDNPGSPSPDNDPPIINAGSVYLYTLSDTPRLNKRRLAIARPSADDQLGTSVAVSEDMVFAGVPGEDGSGAGVVMDSNEGAHNAGAVAVFPRSSDIQVEVLEGPYSVLTPIPDSGSQTIFFFPIVPGADAYFLNIRISNPGITDIDDIRLNIRHGRQLARYLTLSGEVPSRLGAGESAVVTLAYAPQDLTPPEATIELLADDPAFGFLATFVVSGTTVTADRAFTFTLLLSGLSFAQSAPEAMPFGDRVPNLLKYAFNLELVAADASILNPGAGLAGLPSIRVEETPAGRILRVEYLRRRGAGLRYEPLKSRSPGGPWAAFESAPAIQPAGVFGTMYGSPSLWDRVVYQEPIPSSDPRWFARVWVGLGGQP